MDLGELLIYLFTHKGVRQGCLLCMCRTRSLPYLKVLTSMEPRSILIPVMTLSWRHRPFFPFVSEAEKPLNKG